MSRDRNWVAVSICLAAAACDGPGEYPVPSLFVEGQGERVFSAIRYDTLWVYGSAADTVLTQPLDLIVAGDGSLFVLDANGPVIHKFSSAGTLVWSWGVQGEGPGEVMNVRAMTQSPGGGLVLVDSGNRRLVYLSDSGILEREVPLRVDGVVINGIAAVGSDLVLSTTGDSPFVVVSAETGRRLDVEPMPWDGFEELSVLQRYGTIIGPAGGSDRWVFGFAVGNGWFVFERDRVLGTYPYVEHTEFPMVVVTRSRSGETVRTSQRTPVRPDPAGYDLAVRGDTLAVLFGGATSAQLRVIDRYDLRTGQYLSSMLLPRWVHSFATVDDMMFVGYLEEDLYPVLLALRYEEERR